MKILFLGDIVGRFGRAAIKEYLPHIKEKHAVDIVIANGENASGGIGISSKNIPELLHAGIDVLTTGNHIWRHKDIIQTMEKEPRILRPGNYPEGTPGKGVGIYETVHGIPFAVLNFLGTTWLDPLDCPFRKAEQLLKTIPDSVKIRIVDFHAEVTSEKKAFGWFLDGKVSAVFGTHTHVQTADAMILPQGTGYLTDAGMCGVESSVLGMDKDCVVTKFIKRMPVPFTQASGTYGLNGVFVTINTSTGKTTQIELLRHNSPTTQTIK